MLSHGSSSVELVMGDYKLGLFLRSSGVVLHVVGLAVFYRQASRGYHPLPHNHGAKLHNGGYPLRVIHRGLRFHHYSVPHPISLAWEVAHLVRGHALECCTMSQFSSLMCCWSERTCLHATPHPVRVLTGAPITPSFRAKIKCIPLCVPGSSFTHKVTNSKINSITNVYYIKSYYKSSLQVQKD
jgi:hypothetical protein